MMRRLPKSIEARLAFNAKQYADQMIADHGLEGARKIIEERSLNRCPQCRVQRTDAQYVADICPNCGELPLPF
jgi:Zn finger protein HypA/HybF involved in hydrogenase expression